MYVTLRNMNKTLFKRAVKKFGTQTALADHLGITRQYISIIKHGKQKPKCLIDRIVEIANS
jgi:DNA-binding Xre family transcriptional regulator